MKNVNNEKVALFSYRIFKITSFKFHHEKNRFSCLDVYCIDMDLL